MKQPEGVKIKNHADLTREIMRLNQKKADEEEKLKRNFRELYYSFLPSEIIKNAVHNFKTSSTARSKVIKAGLGIGSAFLLKKLFKGKGTLASMILGTASKSLLGKYGDAISLGLSKLGGLFGKHEPGKA